MQLSFLYLSNLLRFTKWPSSKHLLLLTRINSTVNARPSVVPAICRRTIALKRWFTVWICEDYFQKLSAIQQRVYLQFVSSSFFQGWRWWMCGELCIDGDKGKVFLLISFHYYLIKILYILLIVWISNWKSINWCWIYWWGFFYDKNFFIVKLVFINICWKTFWILLFLTQNIFILLIVLVLSIFCMAKVTRFYLIFYFVLPLDAFVLCPWCSTTKIWVYYKKLMCCLG